MRLDNVSVTGFLQARPYMTERAAEAYDSFITTVWALPSYLTSAEDYQTYLGYSMVDHAPPFWLANATLVYAERFAQHLAHIEAAQVEAARSGSEIGGALVLGHRAFNAYMRGAIADAVDEALDDAALSRGRVAFCLDTAHAWGAGIDMADPAAIDELLSAWDARIGLDRLRLMHLNDSRSERGSRLDRHEHIGAGRIGAVGLGHLVRHPSLAHVTTILETPGMDVGYDAINLDRVRALARGEPLPALPPEAFTIRGSRARASTPPASPRDAGTQVPSTAEASTRVATGRTRRADPLP
jgi:hypothetical protein